jgi:hypothetical protein
MLRQVDLREIWDTVGRQSAEWFLLAAVLTNFIYLRGTTRLSFLKSCLADLAMTTFLCVTIPLSMLVWGLTALALPKAMGPDPTTILGLCFFSLIFALISSGAQSGLLRRFKHNVTWPGFWILVLLNEVCMALAFTWALVHVVTPEA